MLKDLNNFLHQTAMGFCSGAGALLAYVFLHYLGII